VFRDTWQFVALDAELSAPGDAVAVELPSGPVLVVRDPVGRLHAFRNLCPRRPHPLIEQRRAHALPIIGCARHALSYALDGAPQADTPGSALAPLAITVVDGVVFVATDTPAALAGRPGPRAPGVLSLPALTTPVAPLVGDVAVAADWKVLVEIRLEADAEDTLPLGERWTRRHLIDSRSPALASWVAYRISPNQWLESGPEGLLVTDILPTATGQSRLRQLFYPARDDGRRSRVARRLMERLMRRRAAWMSTLAADIQRGLESPLYDAGQLAETVPAVIEFRHLIARLGGDPTDTGATT
jgi:phenylpropionate dioxygenase-like ring-hydroxylating dioxygenase large terminal subunit